jgi:GNAT superfamily N-acetyltransferase
MPKAVRAARIALREITTARDPSLTPAYRLLSRTFPPDERVDRREWTSSLQERSEGMLSDLVWHLIVAEDADGQVLGLVSGTYLGSVNVGVIGYLAIEEAARSRGLGSRLRARLRRSFAQDAMRLRGEPLDGVIGEVSRSNPWLRTLATREGVILLDFPYVQPSLRDGDAPTSFTLYYESLSRVRSRLPVGELRRILFAIWRRIYRIPRPLDRPAFRRMMRALAGRRTIGAPTPSRTSARRAH